MPTAHYTQLIASYKPLISDGDRDLSAQEVVRMKEISDRVVAEWEGNSKSVYARIYTAAMELVNNEGIVCKNVKKRMTPAMFERIGRAELEALIRVSAAYVAQMESERGAPYPEMMLPELMTEVMQKLYAGKRALETQDVQAFGFYR